ncbi:MAG: LuxR C-terminal-related transcriptional regulator [Novosphingobium sp.]|uniref:LuxR C-terminal-related transcriptional regulator n=1 Tax=Novosphingobium sp. TaxID=1874826 RepID=UPI0032B7AC7D
MAGAGGAMTADSLTDGERHCLQLLAQGYDIKSIAAECGLSVNAVNERLRSARAKLGTTSSRAAARLLAQTGGAPQKIWDNKSGISPATATRHAAVSGRRVWPLGVLAMLIAVALAAVLISSNHAEPALAALPRVVASYPVDGAVIAPGPFTLRVTFDRPMAPASYSFVATGLGTYPQCQGKPVQSADGRSYSLRCQAASGTAYAVGFNQGRFRGFRAAQGGAPAQSAVIRFRAR